VSGAHDLLGVTQGATRAHVIAAFRRFALTHHPDRGGDPDQFRAGLEAYRRLLGETGRRTVTRSGADVVFHRRRTPLDALRRRARLASARLRP
jgi:curved DNA-binding protein CbpA